MIITRTRPSLYLPACVALWSIISASTAAARNYQDLIAIRFFLGIAEAPFFPGAMYMLSCWYPRKELALRTAFLYSGVLLATAFSGLIAAGVLSSLEGAHGIAGWRWLFIIEGAGSFGAAMIGVFLLPDFPGMKSGVVKWLLTDEEQKVAVERIARDRVSLPTEDSSVWRGLTLAVKDVRTWIFVRVFLHFLTILDPLLTQEHAVYHVDSQSQRLWLQQLLPHTSQEHEAWRQHHHPLADGPPLPSRHSCGLFDSMVQRPPQGARISYFHSTGRGVHWLHCDAGHDQQCGPLRCRVLVHMRLLLLQRHGFQLG